MWGLRESKHVGDRINLLNNGIGVPRTGHAVAIRQQDLARQTGRTTILLDALTDDSVVFCYHGIVGAIRKYVRDRGLVNVRVYDARDLNDVDKQLRGLLYNRDKVYIDNSVLDSMLSVMVDRFYNESVQ